MDPTEKKTEKDGNPRPATALGMWMPVSMVIHRKKNLLHLYLSERQKKRRKQMIEERMNDVKAAIPPLTSEITQKCELWHRNVVNLRDLRSYPIIPHGWEDE